MDVEQLLNAEAIGREALRLEPGGRAALLAQRCGGNLRLRAEVEFFLRMEAPGDGPAAPAESPPSAANEQLETRSLEAPCAQPIPVEASDGPPELETGAEGRRIGPYRVLEQIGQGGMGTVFLAEQERPVRRRVALKVIKLGMDTRQVVARFESERQALALMHHPNIAAVLDAGTTELGRPYFAMEYVPGEPITAYCDKHKLSIRERLELFVHVCQAVQHAHTKGILHRDIKPSNILVMMQDGHPIPKVIDFGVAKALNQRLTEQTVFTEHGLLVGTPEYMSPEQAEMSQLDIDTRTDIYSLGVLLYELLTGTLPFDPRTLREAGYFEIQRIIREVEPPRPSTRLSSLTAAAEQALTRPADLAGALEVRGGSPSRIVEIAERRRTEPRALLRELRRDLDWIVMKCLEKDRTRRYATANGLALEIGRFLNDEPVLAGPPGTGYRLRKWVRRNRSTVVLILLAGETLLGAAIGLFVLSGWAVRSRGRAEAEAAEARFRLGQARSEAIRSQRLIEALLPHVRRGDDFAAFVPEWIRAQYPDRVLSDPGELFGRLFPDLVERVERRGHSPTIRLRETPIAASLDQMAVDKLDIGASPDLAEWLRRNEGPIRELNETLRNNRLHVAVSFEENSLLVEGIIPELSASRRLGQALMAASLFYRSEGRSGDSLQCALSARRLASDVALGGGYIISNLAGCQIRVRLYGLMCRLMYESLAAGAGDPFAEFMTSDVPIPPLGPAADLDIRGVRQIVDEVFTKDSSGDAPKVDADRLKKLAEGGMFGEEKLDLPGVMALDYAQTLTALDECERLNRRLMSMRFEDLIQIDPAREAAHSSDNPLIRDFPRAMHTAFLRVASAGLTRDGTLVAASIARFRATEGRWPESIDAALSTYPMKPLRRDYFGHDFVYRVENDRPILYSVGPDGLDDGGRNAWRLGGRRTGVDVLFYPAGGYVGASRPSSGPSGTGGS